MTEAEWLACRTPRKLLDFLGERLTERKLRLVGCGCCRACRPRFALAECRTAIDVADRIADGLASEREVKEGFRAASFARDMATGTLESIPRRYKTREARAASWALYELVVSLDRESLNRPGNLRDSVCWALEYLSEIDSRYLAERRRQARILRDIVGNPFRPATFDPARRTSTAIALASQMYDSRDFSAMPILADALQDAGCTSDDILDHSRDAQQVHVRGCWVVDLVLGKS